MNFKTLLTVLSLVTFTTAISAADNRELPPGLRKKDKLPPGWEKKQGREKNAAEKSAPAAPEAAPKAVTNAPVTPTPPAATPAPAPVPVKAPLTKQQVQTLRASLDKHTASINTLDNKPAALQAGLAAMQKETRVSVADLQVQRKKHPAFGSAGLLLANKLAVETKKPLETFFNQHRSGKKWADMALENKVDLEALDASVGRVEQAMRSAK